MSLFEKLTRSETLYEAWLHIADRKAAGGIDGTSVHAFAAKATKYLDTLLDDLKEGRYIPEPYLAVKIARKKGPARELGLSSVRDKIVQQAVKTLIEPVIDPHFLNVSYAYRRNKSAYKAVQRVRHIVKTQKKHWVVKSDIHQFFDHIDHAILLKQLESAGIEAPIIHLIELWIGMAKIGSDLKWKPVKAGVPQGNIVSPILSNLYLHPFDQEMVHQDWGYVRYADDFIILCEHKSEAEKAFEIQKKFLSEKLKLKLNSEDTTVGEISEGIHFLGVLMYDNTVSISREKMERLQETLSKGVRLFGMKIDPLYCGKLKTLSAYYGRLLPEDELKQLDHALAEVLVDAIRLWLKRKQIRPAGINPSLLSGIRFFSKAYQENSRKYISGILKKAKTRPPSSQVKKESSANTSRKINSKKKEYEQKAAEARELLITTPGVFLGKAYGQVVVKQQGRGIRKLPLQPLKNITIQSRGVTFSTDLLYECSKKEIVVDFLGLNGKPFGKFMNTKTLDAKTGIAQLEAYQNGKGWKLARAFVLGKIRNQMNLIKYVSKYGGSSSNSKTEWAEKSVSEIEAQISKIQSLGEGELKEKRAELMGIEARAAIAYWQFVRRHLSDYLDFPGREHQGALDPTNQALNYGYGILYGRIWESAVKARLHTSLSYLHSPGEGRNPSLIFDMIEEFRVQAVDRPVYALIRKSALPRVKDGRLLEESCKRIAKVVLERLGRKEKFRKHSFTLSQVILHQGKSLAGYLNGALTSYRPYVRKW